MVLHPEVAKKAQAELDRVVGQNRLPDFSDKAALSYITAIMKECLRWNPVSPLRESLFPYLLYANTKVTFSAVAHRLTEDDVYKGMFMPAGSVVLGNVWAMLHDERHYPEPERFNPERYLKDGKLDSDVRPPEAAAFGFGPR